jgi:hypothetical protein
VIVVKRHGMVGYQIWSTEQLENKLIDMREIYNERRVGGPEMIESTGTVCAEGSCSSSSGVLSGDEAGDMELDKMNPLIDTLFESQVNFFGKIYVFFKVKKCLKFTFKIYFQKVIISLLVRLKSSEL